MGRMKTAVLIILILMPVIFMSGCGTYTTMVRNRYDKIASESKESNADKFQESSFKNYFIYKTTLSSDFDLTYFLAYSHHSEYISIDIYGSHLFRGEGVSTFGNILDNALVKKGDGTTMTSYIMLSEAVISKSLTLELNLRANEIRPGRFRGTMTDRSVGLVIKDGSGVTMFDVSDGKSFVALEIVSVENNTAYGTFSGYLVGRKKAEYLKIAEGEFWVKI